MINIYLIILAAGKGTRLGKLTKNIPKPLLSLSDGSTILKKQLANAAKSGLFSNTFIVTGYNAGVLDSYIKKLSSPLRIETIFNPRFDNYGPLISLWAVREKMLENDFMIINGDTVYRTSVFETLNTAGHDKITLAISRKEIVAKDDMKVVLDQDSCITAVSKRNESSNLVSSGAAFISGKSNRITFVDILRRVESEDDIMTRKGFWHEVFNLLAADNISVKKEEIGLDQWKEIDTVEDLNSIDFCSILED